MIRLNFIRKSIC